MALSDRPSDGLDRFVDAQRGVYEQAHLELSRGRKTSHWMWFVFPQLSGLGSSAMAQRFGIASRAEAAAYVRHDVLGPRLRDCVSLVLAVEGHSALQILGSPDDLKLRSCVTLFAAAADVPDPFTAVLDKYFGGKPDPKTLQLLASGLGES